MIPGIHLDYQELRTISPKAARQATLQILKSCDGNITQTARILKITRATIYKTLMKQRVESLNDSSRAPKIIANKTPINIEEKIVTIKKTDQLRTT